jgi:magnesium-dependent phosphatase 1
LYLLISGVTFHHTPNGIDNQVFEKGLAAWRKRHPVLVVEDAEASVSEA